VPLHCKRSGQGRASAGESITQPLHRHNYGGNFVMPLEELYKFNRPSKYCRCYFYNSKYPKFDPLQSPEYRSTTSAPPGTWAPLNQEVFRTYRLTGRMNQITPVPIDRNTIWHPSCGQVHAPELCRGPLFLGMVDSCAWCGGVDHIVDFCLYLKSSCLTRRRGSAPWSTF
jgi:hypothetical protein